MLIPALGLEDHFNLQIVARSPGQGCESEGGYFFLVFVLSLVCGVSLMILTRYVMICHDMS